MDDVQYLADELTVEKAKTVRTLSIVATALTGAYLLEGILSLIIALIPIPFLGFLISVVLSILEFALLVASIVFVIIALVRSVSMVKKLKELPDNEEKEQALKYAKLARLLSIISAISVGVLCIAFTILNIVELVLSFI